VLLHWCYLSSAEQCGVPLGGNAASHPFSPGCPAYLTLYTSQGIPVLPPIEVPEDLSELNRRLPPSRCGATHGQQGSAEGDICTAAVQMQWAPVCSYMLFGMGRCSPLPQVAAAPWQFTDEIQPAFASQPAGTALITWRKKRWTLPPALARQPSAARLLRPSRQQQKRAPPGQQAPLRRQPQMCRTACHASPLR